MALLLIFLLNPTVILAAESTNQSESERQALLSFKQGIANDPLGVLLSWGNDSLYCSWRGVTCGKTLPPHVISLELNYLQLDGVLPSSLANLTSITRLDLGHNSFQGVIPDELGTLPKLRNLMLANNLLFGVIPHSLATSSSLTVLNLSSNSLSGSIPYFHNTAALQILSLAENNLSGSIPPSLGNVSSITELYLHANILHGSIPETLSRIWNLSVLNLGYNDLFGYVPDKLYNISSLRNLDLGQNSLIGQIPPDIGNSLPILIALIMSGNKIKGSIPASLANASKLQVIDLSSNSLEGPVPPLGFLSKLYILSLGKNHIDVEASAFLTSLANCSRLQILDMAGTYLKGSLPRSFGNLRNLQILSMENNWLTGEIPSTIENLSQLSLLGLDNNKLSRNIPASLGQCKQLVMLNLSANSFYGPIPSQLSNTTSLSLGLDLSHNNLTGPIPPQIGALISLIHLDISFNNFSGEALASLGRCVSLQYLNTKRNMLNGSTSQSFSDLKSIILIDLSQNNFHGPIPVFLVEFVQLILLDLSNNHFEGEIPTGGIFENTTAVILYGNIDLCANANANFASEFAICLTISAGGTKKDYERLLLIVIPLITVTLFSFLCFVVTRSKKTAPTTPCYKDTLKKVSYGDILKATNWLSPVNKISSSCTGSVYIGRFEFDTDLVAIKVFHLDEHGSLNSFLMECEVLRNTRHRNLMKAVTLCSTVDLENNEFKAIVFDLMANGSLDMWVHPKIHQNCPKRGLSLGQRIRIAVDVASALDYMHNQLIPPLIHCDLKPANVLLDYDMTARVGDFGSAKFLSSNLCSPKGFVDLGLGGTIGYIALEYGMGYKISTQCDVYSFGVLLLEMLTGMRPTDAMFTDGMSLQKLVSSAYPNGLCEVLDPYMSQEEDHKSAKQTLQSFLLPLVEVALLCSMDLPQNRPGMRDVSTKIFGISEAFLESG
ncbi:hypothetical protein HU200_067706 [Digitaria exilis]|uniref:non-specific serine/threonine protein kinase n=1 Tax=Digitaria exilis TaxID=1010633 RepID=A0A835DSZ7_9POAL|nr:hypothetical protein HU200_067706 [Digitaria exilis]